jgi:hypothetical protein
VIDNTPQPGAAWLEIVGRPTLQEFSCAFSADPILEATVVAKPLLGVAAVYEFFCTTRSMYDRIAFVQETRTSARAYLEWEGAFQGKGVSGVTILTYGALGAIERIRLFHYPFEQLNSFSVELVRRRSLKTHSFNTLSQSADLIAAGPPLG